MRCCIVLIVLFQAFLTAAPETTAVVSLRGAKETVNYAARKAGNKTLRALQQRHRRVLARKKPHKKR